MASLRFSYLGRPLRHDETPKSVMDLYLPMCIQVVFVGRGLRDARRRRALARRRVGKSPAPRASKDEIERARAARLARFA